MSGKESLGTTVEFAIEWPQAPGSVTLRILHGRLGKIIIDRGQGRLAKDTVRFRAGPARLVVMVHNALLDPGAPATLVHVDAKPHGFTFFLRDVDAQHPIWIPSYNVAVTTAADPRNYTAISDAIGQGHFHSGIQRFDDEPEESFEAVSPRTRNQMCETWLGLSRDIRIFSIGYNERMGYLGNFSARHHHIVPGCPENDGKPLYFNIILGRGAGPIIDIQRRLEDGVLPILHTQANDGPITYDTTCFVTLERTPLTLKNLQGTDYLVADGHGAGHMFTPAQQKEFDARNQKTMELNRKEETILCYRATAVNTDRVPHYAFIKGFTPDGMTPKPWTYDGKTGLGLFPERAAVWGTNKLNGKPMPQREMAVLLKPGAKLVFEFIMPHQPVPLARGHRLLQLDFDRKLAECKAYWHAKLDAGASIHVPEKRVDEMIRAGLLHLDVVAFGREPAGPVAATIGVYCPIGSESSPIIQFMDSMRWSKLAERSLEYFLAKQHDDGFIQNFGGYMLETGPALWSMGEHYRYTRDVAWVRRIQQKVIKACDYLLAWRARNQRADLRGKGYGLIDGKVADPEDHFRQFMLNGYSYVGIQRASEMLAAINPRESRRLAKEAVAWKQDIRKALAQCMAESPVIPVGDGTWAPTLPPWAEIRGPAALYVNGEPQFTHGTFTGRDSMIGPPYLFISEVIDPNEPMGEFLLKTHDELFTINNGAFSQPYYARHDYAHLKRGETAAFLKLYYTTFSALADRQTYTFWEHFFGASPHKTHEEGWFLMQTRWMLWMEDGHVLNLLRGVPRRWLEDGQRIELKGVASHFGPLSMCVTSTVAHSRIEAVVIRHENRPLQQIRLRLPHPQGLKARKAIGGTYDPATETVVVNRPRQSVQVTLLF